MFYYLNGTVALLEADRAVIDCGGVGYLVSITRQTYNSLVSAGAYRPDGSTQGAAKLYTYYHVREDAVELYGFYTERECDFFKMLIAISGVGPKAALAILSTLSTDDLMRAVLNNDAKAIAASPGIGLKSAQKVILELKDKLAKMPFDDDTADFAAASGPAASGDVAGEAVNALTVLGYSRAEAAKAVAAASGTTLEAVIRSALQLLG